MGARESRNGRKKISAKKSKVRNEEPLGTQSYRTSSKRSESFWLLIGATKPLFFVPNQRAARPGVVSCVLTRIDTRRPVARHVCFCSRRKILITLQDAGQIVRHIHKKPHRKYAGSSQVL